MTLSTVPVIFDLDGTLVDPAGGITGGISAALTQLGIRVPAQAQLDAMIGPKLSDSLLNIAGVPQEQLAEVIRLYRAYYLETGIAQSRLYPGIPDLIEEYAASGRPIAVATQKPEGLARIVLEHHGIASSFHFIRGSAADEAAHATAPRGKTEIVAAALSDLRTQHAVMVGDRAQDVAGALANGLDCIGVSWGFAPDGELQEAGAVAIVHSTTDLAATVDSMDALRAAALGEVNNDGIV
ncbi:HAD hydrolase-like protein [Arthrobacter sp. B10-11]|uniref:HAD hydrolase-like protein n=1 Tax=Arthrobacter sp. B10-11 TaxID=3081160 RepID=UPI00295494E7|nr:HAD hydrolase-like protein [Arthrobacter sp. B10-11]MDV8148169.1 HAD hydrolase-like protein [Arthrobacter sp. B10-11]